MLFPRDRKLARSRGPWPRIVAVVGLAAFSCTLPDYEFTEVTPDTCSNNVLDAGETRVDCGGSCDSCTCEEDDDCTTTDQVCVDGACENPCEGSACGPTCSDGEKNGDETDDDCGGGTCKTCPVGDGCKVNEDCEEKVCDGIKCLPASCDDDVKNGSEPSIDCGGECLVKCPNDEPCNSNNDCASATCGDNGKCVPPLCKNGKLDAGESDIDCGGSKCPRCKVDDECGDDDDCEEDVCGDDGRCSEPSCDDGKHNGAETDRDCGGGSASGCDACGTDEHCEEDSDCIDRICTEDEACQAHACDDEVTNGDESDTDCGGEDCAGCPVGDSCDEDTDCALEICNLSSDDPRCVSCNDEKQNGSELGVDCGGSDCALCQPGDICSDDAGCVGYLCNANDRCVTGVALDYKCGQCGDGTIANEVKFSVTLHNLSNGPIDVHDVEVRYYLNPEGAGNIRFGCEYGDGGSCGSQRLVELADADKSSTATHYVETLLGSSERILEGGNVVVEIRVPFDGSMDQLKAYSFLKDGPHLDYQRIVLYRQGTRIWGEEPLPGSG